MKADDPFCAGTQGILDAYDKARNTVTLYGPTCFAPIINHVARYNSLENNITYFGLFKQIKYLKYIVLCEQSKYEHSNYN